ncbi:DUF6221 family protein [Streptomyces virginiae]|uniref:DUF6221 family protein n=1 Tax=Streptomyces virginiae TaxID=1961 RepID=UPI003715C3BF
MSRTAATASRCTRSHGSTHGAGRNGRVSRPVPFTLPTRTAPIRIQTRHDPARVLREVEAERRVRARHVPGPVTGDQEPPWDHRDDCQYDGETWPCETCSTSRHPTGDHPDYPPTPLRRRSFHGTALRCSSRRSTSTVRR